MRKKNLKKKFVGLNNIIKNSAQTVVGAVALAPALDLASA